MKIVVNKCYGGFGLSAEAVEKYAKLSGFKVYGYCNRRDDIGSGVHFDKRELVRYNSEAEPFIIHWVKDDLGDVTNSKTLNEAEWLHERDIKRNDEKLVRVVETLKKKANGSHANLVVVDIPDDVDWEIDEYDGYESIHEKHRSW